VFSTVDSVNILTSPVVHAIYLTPVSKPAPTLHYTVRNTAANVKGNHVSTTKCSIIFVADVLFQRHPTCTVLKVKFTTLKRANVYRMAVRNPRFHPESLIIASLRVPASSVVKRSRVDVMIAHVVVSSHAR
jgi:hypothetical protein